MDPNSGRKKNVTGGSKGVHRRGEGLGTGPVGRADGYSGKHGSNKPSGASGPDDRAGLSDLASLATGAGGGGLSSLLSGKGIIIVIIILLLGGGGGLGGLLGLFGGGSGSGSSGGFNPLSLLGGGSSSSNGNSKGWKTELKNTEKLNTSVASGANDKRTVIKGKGQDTVTIMVYMCGTDLESRSGMASNDLAEMAAADLGDNVNIIVYTGGCKAWKTQGISSSTNQIFQVSKNSLKCIVSDAGQKAMTDPATLTEFIQFCHENYPANREDLIFWDHGGGSLTGYGYDEKFQSAGSMDLSQIDKALGDSGVTFDFIGFDACLMATLENSLMCSKYADYLIASEETEPGIGWYYTDWLNSLANDPSQPTVETGKNIVDGFITECNKKCRGQDTTLSVIELAEISATVPSDLNTWAASTTKQVKSDYKKVSSARTGCREFAPSSRIDQIDLVDFADTLGTTEAKALTKSVLSAVKYNRTSSSMTNAYGVSIYFPYQKSSKVNSAVSTYKKIGVDSGYSECIKAFAGMETTGQVAAGGTQNPLNVLGGGSSSSSTSGSSNIEALLNAFLGGGKSIPGHDAEDASYLNEGDTIDVGTASSYVADNQFDPSKLTWKEKDGKHVLTLTQDQWKLINRLEMNMWVDDGEGYIDMGLDNVYEFTEDGDLIGDSDNTWLAFDGQPVAYYYEKTLTEGDSQTIQGRVPALLNGERVNLIIIFDDSNPNGYIAGARYDYVNGETEAVAKGTEPLADGDKIDLLADYYTYDGQYQDSYMIGDQITYHSNLQISNVDVGADTNITYLFTDLYNQEYWTPVVPQ